MPDWTTVDWSQTMGGNDDEGDCGEVGCANVVNILIQPQIVGRTEIERFYTVETGWTAENPGSDHGSIVEAIIKDWCANGWPADPTLKPTGYEDIPVDQASVIAALQKYVALVCALVLPDDEDFTDAAVTAFKFGRLGHAVCVVKADAEGVTFITWTRVVTVSWMWWDHYARQAWGIAFGG